MPVAVPPIFGASQPRYFHPLWRATRAGWLLSMSGPAPLTDRPARDADNGGGEGILVAALGLPASWIVNPVVIGVVLLAGYSRAWGLGEHRLQR